MHNAEPLATPAARSSAKTATFWFETRVGFIPLIIYIPLALLILGLILTGELKSDLPIMIAVIGMGGATCAEIGKRIPVLGKMGGAAIVSAFLPSYLVSLGWIHADLIKPVTDFTKSSNFIYLFVSAVVVGSIFTMDRELIIKGFARSSCHWWWARYWRWRQARQSVSPAACRCVRYCFS